MVELDAFYFEHFGAEVCCEIFFSGNEQYRYKMILDPRLQDIPDPSEIMSSKESNDNQPYPIPPTAIKPIWYYYYELTRLHKWPLGSILVFWPSGK
jgi:hypothetical protein